MNPVNPGGGEAIAETQFRRALSISQGDPGVFAPWVVRSGRRKL